MHAAESSTLLTNIIDMQLYHLIVVAFLFESRLFEIAPNLQYLFPFKDEDLKSDSTPLKKHAIQVMESIDAAIGMLDNPEELKETLIGLGIVHHMKDVQLASFAVSVVYDLLCLWEFL